jgi:DivIVA domain-containing protein
MPKILLLSSSEILNKEFHQVPRGYDAHEVDAYLDKILLDYQKIEANKLLVLREYEELILKIEELTKENSELNIELQKYKNRLKNIKDEDDEHINMNNINLIKRIRAYEKHLWNIGINPQTIKS